MRSVCIAASRIFMLIVCESLCKQHFGSKQIPVFDGKSLPSEGHPVWRDSPKKENTVRGFSIKNEPHFGDYSYQNDSSFLWFFIPNWRAVWGYFFTKRTLSSKIFLWRNWTQLVHFSTKITRSRKNESQKSLKLYTLLGLSSHKTDICGLDSRKCTVLAPCSSNFLSVHTVEKDFPERGKRQFLSSDRNSWIIPFLLLCWRAQKCTMTRRLFLGNEADLSNTLPVYGNVHDLSNGNVCLIVWQCVWCIQWCLSICS